jgi:hypothetical protein
VRRLTGRPQITTVALADSLSHLALGLADGTVLLYRHLDQALASGGGALSALPKPRALHEGTPAEPVTGLGFRAPRAPGAPLHLFVVTPARVLAYAAAGRGAGGAGAGHVVDELGAALGCAVMDGAADEIVLARDEAIYLCGTEGRGMSIAYEGAALAPAPAPSNGADDARRRAQGVRAHARELPRPRLAAVCAVRGVRVRDRASLRALERAGRGRRQRAGDHEARAARPPEQVRRALWPRRGRRARARERVRPAVRALQHGTGARLLWVRFAPVLKAGQLLCVEEKPMAAKLDMLYQRGLYQLALALARTQELDAERTADVHRAYGDHLYGRGEHDGAMAQYVQTIGVVPPSYVIRKVQR